MFKIVVIVWSVIVVAWFVISFLLMPSTGNFCCINFIIGLFIGNISIKMVTFWDNKRELQKSCIGSDN